MPRVPERPIFTRVFESWNLFTPTLGATYFYGRSSEARSLHTPEWEDKASGVSFVAVTSDSSGMLRFEQQGVRAQDSPVRASRRLRSVVDSLAESEVYLDITGLPHHVWAPMLRAILGAGKRCHCVYVEPEAYKRAPVPTDSDIYDLSERIEGISPIPGFASLARDDDNFVLVTLLGFEGARFQFLLEQVEPTDGQIFPVIGVPGFRPEYPYVTYLSNRTALLDTRSWERVRYARANCPFSLLWTLEDIAFDWPTRVLRIAPIGTKPHALGAILFYLYSPRAVEIIYDHPIRSHNRTSGASRVLLYNVSALPFHPDKLALDAAVSG